MSEKEYIKLTKYNKFFESPNMVKKAAPSSRDEQSSTSSSSDDEQGLEAMERMLSDGTESDEDSGDSDSDVEADGDDNSNGPDDEDVSEDDNLPSTDTSNEQVDQEDYREDNDVMMNGEENCTLDLRNLLAMNSHQVNYRALYQKENSDDGELTINTIGFQKASESHLLEKATEGCSQLLKGLWELETEKTDAGPLAVLPSYFVNKTPRELVSNAINAIDVFPKNSYEMTVNHYIMSPV